VACTIYLVRHGQSEANARITLDSVDQPLGTPLSPEGKRQAAWLCEWLQDQEIDAVYASDLIRARETAEIALPHLPPTLITQLREGGAISPGVEETAEEVSARLCAALAEIASNHSGQTILVVCHGFAMRAFLVGIGAGTFETFPTDAIGNVGRVCMRCDGSGFEVETMANYRFGGNPHR
jgi:broad specificity phosphatase PhoE